jgi:hypothetical protein
MSHDAYAANNLDLQVQPDKDVDEDMQPGDEDGKGEEEIPQDEKDAEGEDDVQQDEPVQRADTDMQEDEPDEQGNGGEKPAESTEQSGIVHAQDPPPPEPEQPKDSEAPQLRKSSRIIKRKHNSIGNADGISKPESKRKRKRNNVALVKSVGPSIPLPVMRPKKLSVVPFHELESVEVRDLTTLYVCTPPLHCIPTNSGFSTLRDMTGLPSFHSMLRYAQ